MGAIRRGTMQLLAVTVVLLLAIARVQSAHAEKEAAEAIRIDLMQYFHEKSPYADPKLSLKDRIRIVVASSRARVRYFNSRISKGSKYVSKAFSTPQYSNEGDYLMRVGVGSPAQEFVAIADTGSDLFWLQCNCLSCYPQPSPYFDPTTSSTFSPEICTSSMCQQLPTFGCTTNSQCEYAYGYGDQSSTQGILSSDVITLGSTTFTGQFGCGEANQGTFSNTDGLVGLGRGPVSIISQMGVSAFSYCLVSFYSSTSKTSALVFGDSGGSYSYTPLVFNAAIPTFYYVNLNGISVNGVPLSIPAGTFSLDSAGDGGFILDSGTTVTQLQNAAYTPLLTKVQSLISYPAIDGSSVGLDACYTVGSNPTWPSVTFKFQGVDVVLPGDNLFLRMDSQGSYCMAIQDSGSSFGIYGNVQQQNFNIKYDIGSSRIGFSSTTC